MARGPQPAVSSPRRLPSSPAGTVSKAACPPKQCSFTLESSALTAVHAGGMSARRGGSAPQRWRGSSALDVTLDWLSATAGGAHALHERGIGLRARAAQRLALRLASGRADRAASLPGSELGRARRDLSPGSPRRLSFKARVRVRSFGCVVCASFARELVREACANPESLAASPQGGDTPGLARLRVARSAGMSRRYRGAPSLPRSSSSSSSEAESPERPVRSALRAASPEPRAASPPAARAADGTPPTPVSGGASRAEALLAHATAQSREDDRRDRQVRPLSLIYAEFSCYSALADAGVARQAAARLSAVRSRRVRSPEDNDDSGTAEAAASLAAAATALAAEAAAARAAAAGARAAEAEVAAREADVASREAELARRERAALTPPPSPAAAEAQALLAAARQEAARMLAAAQRAADDIAAREVRHSACALISSSSDFGMPRHRSNRLRCARVRMRLRTWRLQRLRRGTRLRHLLRPLPPPARRSWRACRRAWLRWTLLVALLAATATPMKAKALSEALHTLKHSTQTRSRHLPERARSRCRPRATRLQLLPHLQLERERRQSWRSPSGASHHPLPPPLP
jgi:hypothetical protein